jgi:hypothetical protein
LELGLELQLHSAELVNDPCDLPVSLFDNLRARLWRGIDALGEDESEVGDADEGQNFLEIRA